MAPPYVVTGYRHSLPNGIINNHRPSSSMNVLRAYRKGINPGQDARGVREISSRPFVSSAKNAFCFVLPFPIVRIRFRPRTFSARIAGTSSRHLMAVGQRKNRRIDFVDFLPGVVRVSKSYFGTGVEHARDNLKTRACLASARRRKNSGRLVYVYTQNYERNSFYANLYIFRFFDERDSSVCNARIQ